MKNKKITMIAIITFAVLLVVGGTYAAWSIFYTSDANVITSGMASMKFKETNEIEINNALPMNDNDGKAQTNYFDFSVSTYVKTRADDNTGQKTTYNVIAEPLAIDTTTYIAFQNSEIKVYLTKVEEGIETQVLAPTTIGNLNNYLLETHEEEFKNNKQEVTTNYRLRAWVDFNVDASNWNTQAQKHSYKFRININGEASSNVKLTGITIQTPPTKTTYMEEETFDTTGMVIEAAYTDGSTRTITDYTISPDRTLETTDTGITITYQGKVVTQNITVQSKIAVQNIISKVGTDGLVAITHPADSTLQLGATEDITEYRYQGANPNNYVNFDGTNGDYRIIGVFKTDDGEGNITNRIKLIKTSALSEYSWGDRESMSGWEESELKSILNDYYFLGDAYYNLLKNKALVDNVKYYLGGYNDLKMTNETMYQYERKKSGNTPTGNPNSWIGKLGLMYVSDYMYGTGSCYDKTGGSYDLSICTSTNWLFGGTDEWTIAQVIFNSIYALFIDASGFINLDQIFSRYSVRPVFYLDEQVVILDGIGTIDDPYTFGSAE